MINFHSVSHVPHSTSRALEFVGDESDLVASLYQALAQLVAVRLHSSKFREGKVGTNQNAIFLATLMTRLFMPSQRFSSAGAERLIEEVLVVVYEVFSYRAQFARFVFFVIFTVLAEI